MRPALLLGTALLGLGSPHPIHTSSAEIVASEGTATVAVTVRAFAEDFPPGNDPAAAAAYLSERFRIRQRDGRLVAVRLDHLRLEGPVAIATLRATVPGGLAGARVWHGVLTERFNDQVNLVVARYGGRAVRLLFTAADSAKSLP